MSWWSMIPKRTKVSGIRRMMSGGYRHALLIVAVFIPYSVAVEEMLSIKAMDLFFPLYVSGNDFCHLFLHITYCGLLTVTLQQLSSLQKHNKIW